MVLRYAYNKVALTMYFVAEWPSSRNGSQICTKGGKSHRTVVASNMLTEILSNAIVSV